MGTPDAPLWAAEAGVSYRQLDYWARQGWLRPGRRNGRARSGHPRIWPEREQEVAAVMGRLVAVGFDAAAAAPIARTVAAADAPIGLDLGHGITLCVAP